MAFKLAGILREQDLVTIISPLALYKEEALLAAKGQDPALPEGVEQVFYLKDERTLLVKDFLQERERIINIEGTWEE